jgi:phenylalanyl-tRNA synthetase beta chain
VLCGLGLVETNTYNLSNPDDQNLKMENDMKLVELESAVNTDYNVLRAWMIPSLLKVLKDNKSAEYPQNIFESGTCFKLDVSTETGVSEFTRLGVCLCGPDADFTRVKQVMDVIFQASGIKYESNDVEHPSFIPGRVARISVGGKGVAYIGELHPQVLENWELDMPVACLELNLTDLQETLSGL